MRWEMIKGCVTGASHIIKQMPCQDAIKTNFFSPNSFVCAIADGHGSSACPYSDEGAEIAVSVALAVIEILIWQNDEASLYSLLQSIKEVQLPRAIEKEWKEQIQYHHQQKERGDYPKAEQMWKLYGSTLIILWVMPDFVFALQIGDGDLLQVDAKGETKRLILAEQQYGTETYSLCQKECWRYFKHKLIPIATHQSPCLFLMSTDGYANSFTSEKDFLRIGKDYLELLKHYDSTLLEEQLPVWLNEASSKGSGDDITLAVIYQNPMRGKEHAKTNH
ncbi:protein phosphatase 2C domain-containing protein [Cellulosilyticum sp. WCF-2]|nr:protein phosphatase 2C domain-containing protein [Cellulosilyticum sp. WCF-2]